MKRKNPDNYSQNNNFNQSNKRQKLNNNENTLIIIDMLVNRINNLEQNIISKVNEIEQRLTKIEKEIQVPEFKNDPSYFY